MDIKTHAKGAAIAFALVATPVVALVIGQEVSYRVKMMKRKPMMDYPVPAYVNVDNQIR